MKSLLESYPPPSGIDSAVPDHVPAEWTEQSAWEEAEKTSAKYRVGKIAILAAGVALSGLQMVHETIEPVHVHTAEPTSHAVVSEHRGDILDDFVQHPDSSAQKQKSGGAYETDLWDLVKIDEQPRIVLREESGE